MNALHALDSDVPEPLRVFDRACERAPVGYDAFEFSAKVASGLDCQRTTRYFDTGRYPEEKIREVDALFRGLGSALNVRTQLLNHAILDSEVRFTQPLQTVLGLDAGDPARLRLKYYWVLRAHSPNLVTQLLKQLDVPAPAGLDLDKVYICGLDFDVTGLHDLKLYFALERMRLARTVKNLAPVRGLLEDCKLVCFQHCLLRHGKRQLFFHARHSHSVQRTLERLARSSSWARELLAHVTALNTQLASSKLAPWIIAFPYDNGYLDYSAFNVYFHPEESDCH